MEVNRLGVHLYKCDKCETGVIERIVTTSGPHAFRHQVNPCDFCKNKVHLLGLNKLEEISDKQKS
jgi:hypothetical protein